MSLNFKITILFVAAFIALNCPLFLRFRELFYFLKLSDKIYSEGQSHSSCSKYICEKYQLISAKLKYKRNIHYFYIIPPPLPPLLFLKNDQRPHSFVPLRILKVLSQNDILIKQDGL